MVLDVGLRSMTLRPAAGVAALRAAGADYLEAGSKTAPQAWQGLGVRPATRPGGGGRSGSEVAVAGPRLARLRRPPPAVGVVTITVGPVGRVAHAPGITASGAARRSDFIASSRGP